MPISHDETVLASGDQQRRFGGIALNRPPAILMTNGSIVGTVGCRQRLIELGTQCTFDGLAAVGANASFRCVPRTVECGAAARGDDDADRHFVPRERPGLIGGDDSGGAERLHCGEVPDDSVSACHALDAD
jgi:hypothetical protein